MARRFSVRPAISLKGRTFKGLRGFSGKPSHPPLTDFPVAAYVFAMVFDIVSAVAGDDSTIGHDFFVSATHVLIAGAAVSLFTALTGFVDWRSSTEPGTQARRTANWHMAVMLAVTALVLVNIALRLAGWDDGATPPAVVALSVLVGVLVGYGAAYGGSLVYDYGFNVENAGDHTAWHRSEEDHLG